MKARTRRRTASSRGSNQSPPAKGDGDVAAADVASVMAWVPSRSCRSEPTPPQLFPTNLAPRPIGRPATQPHEYVRQGTTKLLTLFRPATGEVRVQPATRGTNAVLHGWLKQTLAAIVAALPAGAGPSDPAATRALWEAWQQGLTVRFTLPPRLPPLP